MLTTELLGYPADSKLLILNIDDFGFCFTANQSAIETYNNGVASSCTIMMPPAWSKHASGLLTSQIRIFLTACI